MAISLHFYDCLDFLDFSVEVDDSLVGAGCLKFGGRIVENAWNGSTPSFEMALTGA